MILLAFIQGAYFAATGLWPIVHIRSFIAVTGPKRDLWLVKTVGAVVSVIGLVLLLAGGFERITPEIVVLAIGSAASLAAVDVVYVVKRVISPIYLFDAAAEVALIAAWVGVVVAA